MSLERARFPREREVTPHPGSCRGQLWGLALLSLQLPAEGILGFGLLASACLWGWTPISTKSPPNPYPASPPFP